ncbi:MAG: hypothetical protein JW947_02665 [Sedimentisphaerales bacterium]|nr:hypothetical protein [Sedimentisphaerales bacterium]
MALKMEKLIVFVVFVAFFFCGGCGFVGLVGSESPYEKKVPAEYDLASQKNKKVLVLVEQPNWLSSESNLRYYLTRAVHENLAAKVKVKSKNIIPYNELAEFRTSRSDFSSLLPAEAGTALGADIVLLVMIEGFQLNDVAGTGYYNGFLSVQAAIYETGGGKVWPMEAAGKSIKVGFETGERGQEMAVGRLVSACAYCITRYFYNCPEYKFKISDEGGRSSWDSPISDEN